MTLNINEHTIAGHLGDDVEIKFTKSGKRVANLSVATNRRFKDKDGSYKEKTQWHRVVVFGSDTFMNAIEKNGKKGAAVYVKGESQSRDYLDKEGVKRYVTEIIVSGPESKCKFYEAKASADDTNGGDQPPMDDYDNFAPEPF